MKQRAYLNKKQKAFLKGHQKTKIFMGGRGSGKSDCLGTNQRLKMGAMPKSKGFLASTTYNQMLTKTWPAIQAAWTRYGLVEGVHYVVGIKPPKYFETPISPPKKYNNVISVMNGRCIEMISLDRPDLARGGSYDDGDIDEAALLKKEHWTKILLPSIRGNTWRFNTHYHQMVGMYTSIPWKSSGYWIFDYEEMAKASPDEYLWISATARDNINIITEAGIERMRRELPPAEFMIEVMNQRIIRVEDCFYHSLEREQHCYDAQYIYGEDDHGRPTVIGCSDHNADQILESSWDFGGWFNCATIWQAKGMQERMINSFYATVEYKLSHVVDGITTTYRSHRNKYIRIYGEPRGHDRQPNLPSVYEQLRDLFEARGWEVEIMVPPGYASKQHKERREFVNTILAETDRRLPTVRFNQDNCKSPLIAMEMTQTKPDGTKDKSKEKDRDFPQQHAPHFTDNFDYFLMQKHGWRITSDQSQHEAGEATFV